MARCYDGLFAATLLISLSLGGGAAARTRMFSYDPANSLTRQTSGGLTFRFDQRLTGVLINRVMATEGNAGASLRPSPEAALGPRGLAGVLARPSPEHDLYEVLSTDQGGALISAFCPGAQHAWMAFGRLRSGHDLRVLVLGAGPSRAHLCQTLDFTFRAEWKLPPTPRIDPTQFDPPVLDH